jgi:hypothetical protein
MYSKCQSLVTLPVKLSYDTMHNITVLTRLPLFRGVSLFLLPALKWTPSLIVHCRDVMPHKPHNNTIRLEMSTSKDSLLTKCYVAQPQPVT